jgi:hypothetical protein
MSNFCNNLASINDVCYDSAGGGVCFFVSSWSGFTITENSGITGMVQTLTPGVSGLKKFVPLQDSIQFTQTASETIGNTAKTAQLMASFIFEDITRRNLMAALATTRVVVIVKDSNSRYWLMGYERGGRCIPSSDSGKAIGDASLWNVTFNFAEPDYIYGVTASAMTSYDI